MTMASGKAWTCAYELDERQAPVAGSPDALAAAIRRGADVRIYTTFDWGDHMSSDADRGLVEEMIDLRVTYLLDHRWVAGLTALRYPAEGGLGFTAEPSLSFFMYNQDGQFGIARPYFRSLAERASGNGQPNSIPGHTPRYHVIDATDQQTNSPIHNAVYDFGRIRGLIRDDWDLVLEHDDGGSPLSGSLARLCEAFRDGCSVKVVIDRLCAHLSLSNIPSVNHEVAFELGSMYYHQDRGFHSGESLPLVRIRPRIPLAYDSGGWDFGWILPRTDGTVFQLIVDPMARTTRQIVGRHAIRWFVR